MKAEEVALRFVEAVNCVDVYLLSALMTEGHVFIDSDSRRVRWDTDMAKAPVRKRQWTTWNSSPG